jgi:hypothetical protein
MVTSKNSPPAKKKSAPLSKDKGAIQKKALKSVSTAKADKKAGYKKAVGKTNELLQKEKTQVASAKKSIETNIESAKKGLSNLQSEVKSGYNDLISKAKAAITKKLYSKASEILEEMQKKVSELEKQGKAPIEKKPVQNTNSIQVKNSKATSKKEESSIKEKLSTTPTSTKSSKGASKPATKESSAPKHLIHGKDQHFIPAKGEQHLIKGKEKTEAEKAFKHSEETALHQEQAKIKNNLATRQKRVFVTPRQS